jgi:hypothetical protein
VVAFGTIALIAAGVWLAKRGVLTAPVLRTTGLNLEATKSGATPTLWLCAHLDSKSQPIPTLVRSAGIVLEGIGVLIAFAMSIAVAAGAHPHPAIWLFAGLVTLVGAIPVVLSTVSSRSPGALDNASGVVTILEAAGALRDRGDVGVLITDAEELGLAGARAWSQRTGKATVLNCDGVDDHGDIVVMFTGERPHHLLNAVGDASRATSIVHRASRMIPGVLTDSVAFADAGLPSVTFSRGSWRSLARVHSRRDDVAHLHGTGIAQTAALIAATVRQIIDSKETP